MGLLEEIFQRRIFYKATSGIRKFVSEVGWEVSTEDLCFPGKPLNRFYLHPPADTLRQTVESPERQIIVEVSFEHNEIRIKPPYILKAQEFVIPFSHFSEELLVSKLKELYQGFSSPNAETLSEDTLDDLQNTLALGWYYREDKQEFRLAKVADKYRATHIYVIGATGTGKTKFLEFLIQQDIKKGNGFGVIDPHGDLIEDIKGFLAYHHNQGGEILDRVVLIDPTDPEYTVVFNPLERLPNVSVAEQVQELVAAFKKIWSDSWGVRMEDLLRNSLIALGEAGLTLVDLPKFLSVASFRESVLRRVDDPIVVSYFQRFESLSRTTQLTWIEPVMNKMDALFADERIRQIFSLPKSTFNLREIIDEGKILLVKLDKGRLKGSADLLGSLLLAKLQMAVFSRSDLPPSKRRPFYLYIDEFQNFATESFASLLSEARKYGLSLILAHQTLAQIPRELRELILGNTGIQVYFRLNRHDSQILAKEAFEFSGYEIKTFRNLHPIFWTLGEEWEKKIEELQNLPPRCCWVKHKIEGGIIPLFTVEVEPPWEALGMEEEEYHRYLKELCIGKNYLIPRRKLTAKRLELPPREIEKMAKMETKTTVVEEASLAKVLEPEEHIAPKAEVKEEADEERVSQHRYLQSLIKMVAEDKGYRVRLEQPILDGTSRVDVELELNGRVFACEISITSSPAQEILKLKKCLQANYEKVIFCSPKGKTLEKVKELAFKEFGRADLEKILFLRPEELFSYLDECAASILNKEDKIKGYKVKVEYKPINEEEKKARRETMVKVILDSLRREREKAKM